MKRLARAGCSWPSSRSRALVVAGCGGNDNDANGNPAVRAATRQAVNLTQGSGLTFAMVTHSDEGSFWSVVKKGAEQAAKDEGVKLIWSPSNNDPQKEAQLIDAAVSQKVDGLAVSVPNADAIKGSLAKAQGGRHPDHHAELRRRRLQGARRDHARRPDRGDRRRGGGREAQGRRASRRCSASSTSRTTSASSSAATASSRASAATVTNLQVKGTADIATTQTEIKSKLQADKSFDARHRAQPGHRRRGQDGDQGRELGREARDVRPQPARSSRTSRPATSLFAVDQQQYLQGYLPIVFLKLFKPERQHRRRRPAGPHRPGLRRQDQRRDGREAGRGGHPLATRMRRPARARPAGPSAARGENLMDNHAWRRPDRRPPPRTSRRHRRSRPATSGWRRSARWRGSCAARRSARCWPRSSSRSSSGRRTRCSSSSTASRTGPTSPRRSASRRSSSRC